MIAKLKLHANLVTLHPSSAIGVRIYFRWHPPEVVTQNFHSTDVKLAIHVHPMIALIEKHALHATWVDVSGVLVLSDVFPHIHGHALFHQTASQTMNVNALNPSLLDTKTKFQNGSYIPWQSYML